MFLTGDTISILRDALFHLVNNTIDYGLYTLVSVIFDVFFVLAKLDIFGSTPLGQQLYESLSSRVYTILSIVMVFIFAYNLLLYVMQPDGRYVSEKLKPTILLKRIVFSMVLLVMSPIIFRYMSTFQNHVLVTDTIPALILGKEYNGTDVMSKGKKMAMMTWMTFYHPEDKTYGDFVRDYSATTCTDYFVDPNETADPNDANSAKKYTEMERQFIQNMISTCTQKSAFNTHTMMPNSNMYKDDSGIEKLPIISSIGAVAILIFAIGYVYSVGGRIFRLFVLQIFAPVPIVMRIFDKDKNFGPWIKDLAGTYLDVFIRVAVITFVLYMCTMLPDIINSVSDAVLNEILFG